MLTDSIQDSNVMKKRIYETAYKYDMVQTFKEKAEAVADVQSDEEFDWWQRNEGKAKEE